MKIMAPVTDQELVEFTQDVRFVDAELTRAMQAAMTGDLKALEALPFKDSAKNDLFFLWRAGRRSMFNKCNTALDNANEVLETLKGRV